MTAADPGLGGEPGTERDGATRPDWLLSTDERLLSYFDANGPSRCPRAAGALGLHVPFARRRCEALRRHGYLAESDSRFRLTRDGRALADDGDLIQ